MIFFATRLLCFTYMTFFQVMGLKYLDTKWNRTLGGPAVKGKWSQFFPSIRALSLSLPSRRTVNITLNFQFVRVRLHGNFNEF